MRECDRGYYPTYRHKNLECKEDENSNTGLEVCL